MRFEWYYGTTIPALWDSQFSATAIHQGNNSNNIVVTEKLTLVVNDNSKTSAYMSSSAYIGSFPYFVMRLSLLLKV